MMKTLIAGLIVSVALLALPAQPSSACTTCKAKYSDNVPLTVLKKAWPHYRHKSESAAKRDLEKALRKEGYVKFEYRSWQRSDKGPGRKYKDVEHKNVRCKKKGQKSWESCESLLKAKACVETSSGPELKTFYGWY